MVNRTTCFSIVNTVDLGAARLQITLQTFLLAWTMPFATEISREIHFGKFSRVLTREQGKTFVFADFSPRSLLRCEKKCPRTEFGTHTSVEWNMTEQECGTLDQQTQAGEKSQSFLKQASKNPDFPPCSNMRVKSDGEHHFQRRGQGQDGRQKQYWHEE